MLELLIRHSDTGTTICCKGRIVLGSHLDLFRGATLSQTASKVMLDLSRVHLVDAAGLGVLVDLHKRFLNTRRTIDLIDPTPFVCQVFRITCLHTVFHILRTRDIGLTQSNALGVGVGASKFVEWLE